MHDENGADPRLLIVDYHEDTNRAMVKLLGLNGYDVHATRTLGDAEQFLFAKPVNLVICRIYAVDGDGAEFIDRIWKRHGIPSVAMAGSIENRTRAARLCPDAMRGIIQIPSDLRSLLEVIHAGLTRSKSRPGVCPLCNGLGNITLLVSKRPCDDCDGTGLSLRISRHGDTTGSQAAFVPH